MGKNEHYVFSFSILLQFYYSNIFLGPLLMGYLEGPFILIEVMEVTMTYFERISKNDIENQLLRKQLAIFMLKKVLYSILTPQADVITRDIMV